MDFVLLGFGTGALLILAGRAVRVYGPRIRRQRLASPAPFADFVAGLAWRRNCRGVGLIATLAGATLCMLTLLLLMANASDRSGMVIIAFSLLAIIVGSGIWAALFTHPEWRSRGVSLTRTPMRQRTIHPSGAGYDAAVASWPAAERTVSSTNGWQPATSIDDPAATLPAEASWPKHPGVQPDDRTRSPETLSSETR